jgi:hypothetical protein
MLADEELDQIINAIDHEAAALQLLFRRRISPLGSCCENPQSRRTSLMQGDATIRPERVFAQPGSRSSGPIEHDEHFAPLGRDLDAETRAASIPIDNIF